MQISKTTINDTYIIANDLRKDNRGGFLKTFSQEFNAKNNLSFEIKEVFHTISQRGTIRAMHFQTPPYPARKIVTCLKGKILDVLLDLRPSSPSFLQTFTTILDTSNNHSLYIENGIAHGYLVLEDSIVQYIQDENFSPIDDSGIKYNSFGFDWDKAYLSHTGAKLVPIMSAKDLELAELKTFLLDNPYK